MATPAKRILCIEDDAETAELIAEDLQERGYIVSIARDGHSGLSAILKTDPDLVLCDINMPGMSGFEVMEQLIALAPSHEAVPFVFLTARTDRDSELKGRRLGADDYVTKPVDFEILASIIDARLGKSRPQRGVLAPRRAERARDRMSHLVGARQDFPRDRADREHQQAHRQFSHRERVPQAQRLHAHRGRREGDLGPPDRSLSPMQAAVTDQVDRAARALRDRRALAALATLAERPLDPRTALLGDRPSVRAHRRPGRLRLGALAAMSIMPPRSYATTGCAIREFSAISRTTCPTTAPPRRTVCWPRPPPRMRRATRRSRRCATPSPRGSVPTSRFPRTLRRRSCTRRFAQQWAAYQAIADRVLALARAGESAARHRAVQDPIASGVRSVERHAEPADRSDARQGAPRQRPRRLDLCACADHARDGHFARGAACWSPSSSTWCAASSRRS